MVLIKRIRTDALSPASMYVAGAVAALMGIMFLGIAVPHFFSNLPGDFTGGVAASIIALILLVAGGLAFRVAFARSSVLWVEFFDKGVKYGTPKEKASFSTYAKLEELVVEIPVKVPGSKLLEGLAIASAVLSGDAGLAAGVIVNSKAKVTGARVTLRRKNGETVHIGVPIDDAKQIAAYANEQRKRDVLREVSV